MPIYKEKDTTIIKLGVGDVLFSMGRKPEDSHNSELLFIPFAGGSKNRIGERITEEEWAPFANKTTDEIDVSVRVIFNEIDSLESLILTLLELREEMQDAN